MAKSHLIAASVAAVFAVASAAAAADDASVLKQAREIFKPLPADMATPDSPIAAPRVELGRMLFFDPRFTIDANMSCATCHQPVLYGTDGLPRSIGVRQRPHPRNAPTILNSALSITHWRGDRESVEDQVIKAMTSPITFGQPDEKAVLDRLGQIPGYAPHFKAAFPGEVEPMTTQNMAKAIGAYERTLVTPSPFDAYLAGNVEALSPMARAGLARFIDTGKFGILEDYWNATGSQTIDKGRVDVTKDPDDLYVFRVPSLRNVAMTAPYFHDGSVPTLPGAVKVMARVQLGVTLSEADTGDIVAFLKSLTGEPRANFTALPVLPEGAVMPAK
jgi:cytochrome c peroxidase